MSNEEKYAMLVCLECNGVSDFPENNGDFARLVGKIDEEANE